MAEEDLYGDLDTSEDALKIKGLEAELAASESLRRKLDGELAASLKKEQLLREENEQLAKNISSLYNTARAEITRKDKWIHDLRQRVEAAEERIRKLSSGGGGGGGGGGSRR